MRLTPTLPAPTPWRPLATKVGPFPQEEFLRGWHEELGGATEPMLASWDNGDLAMMRLPDGTIELLAEGDLCDYHSPRGVLTATDFAELAEALREERRLALDSLPAEASEPLAAGLAAAGMTVSVRDHQNALVLSLQSAVDDFYASLGKKERHELRRKRRRYEDAIGKIVLRTEEGAGPGFEEFVRLHRLAAGAKGQFLTGARERFFRRIARQPGWRVDLLEVGQGASACLFGYSDGTDYYLYNSSYDPSLAAASPGLVMITAMIEHAIEMGYAGFDFLKGDEDYKLRLGAVRRPLFVVEADWAKP